MEELLLAVDNLEKALSVRARNQSLSVIELDPIANAFDAVGHIKYALTLDGNLDS